MTVDAVRLEGDDSVVERACDVVVVVAFEGGADPAAARGELDGGHVE